MHVLLYCFKDVGAVEIGVRKVGGIEREYKNACDWIGMETICNHLVLQRSQAIGEQACSTPKNDHKRGEETDATKRSSFLGNAQAYRAANPWDCDQTTDGK